MENSLTRERRVFLAQIAGFWETYFQQYAELRPIKRGDFIQWQIVIATASLVWVHPLHPMTSELPSSRQLAMMQSIRGLVIRFDAFDCIKRQNIPINLHRHLREFLENNDESRLPIYLCWHATMFGCYSSVGVFVWGCNQG
jgi:hypothetical protein